MKTFAFFIVCFVSIWGVFGKPNPKAPTTTPIPDLVDDTNTTATTPIWLRFLKNKKISTSRPSTTELPLPQNLLPTSRLNKSTGKMKLKNPLIVSNNVPTDSRRSVPSSENAPTNSLDGVLDMIAEYFHITPAPNGYLSGDPIAQDRLNNPDTLYDQMYLDWIKKREISPQIGVATPMPPQVQPDLGAVGAIEDPATQSQAINNPSVPLPPVAAPALSYPAGLPPVPLAYSPFFPSLAGFKMQKAMVQAQLDAGLASLGFTTTPKPIKLKLKIQIPGMTDITQLGQITSALNANLPPGSILELA